MQNAIVDTARLKPGWYALGIEDEEGDINWDTAPLYNFIGDHTWVDEAGNIIDGFWDNLLQVKVSMFAADAYLPQ
jgi:predicted lipoprotein with Yx(FWY)xxD motif